MNKCRYISEYHQNIILQHCNSIHFKYTPQTTILFRELPRSPEHLGRPVAVRGWAASWRSQCSLHVTRAMEPCWCWRQLSLVTDRMGSSTAPRSTLHWVYSAGTTNQFPAWSPLGAVTDRRCGDHQRPNRSWTKHKEGSVCMNEGHQRRGKIRVYKNTHHGACCQL